MKLITRNTDYAIRALCYIAKNEKKVLSVKGLVKESKITKPFLRKILQHLNKKGFLKSTRGKGGGFVLMRKPGLIRVREVIEAFQGKIQLSEHVFIKRLCPHIKVCKLKKALDGIEKNAIRVLNSITIKDLIKNLAR
ncbi:MAG: Rrf2 family transcriptional regulator [Candidatus Omnitrophica bacterium]|nr:Rrf2 family transcriptional regulator [Candidatus Omnitrophota bacterium]